MDNERFFELSSYHILLAAVGTLIVLAYWLPRLITRRQPAASGLLILFGLTAFTVVPGMPGMIDPRAEPMIWERLSEMAVIVALFGAGLRIDRLGGVRKWRPTVQLLVIAMPLTIFAVAVLGYALAGMTIAGAVLLGAVLSPTDPVLAGDIRVGPPSEGGEHPVRFTLTTEAGLNDGLAFPFVYLGLVIAAESFAPAAWGWEWFVRDVVYRITVGAGTGWLAGWLLGQMLFVFPRGARLAETASGIVALAGVFLCYGFAEILEGYGFIAVAVAGLMLRQTERDHEFHRELHDFSEAIEHALTAIILVMLGAALPILFESLDLRHALIALALILIIRPAAGWLSLIGTSIRGQDRLTVAIYGVRGIGSIYYLAYAAGKIEFINEPQIWALIAFTILVSTVLHGFTAGIAMERIRHDRTSAVSIR